MSDEIKKVGDWEKVRLLIANLSKEMEGARQDSLRRWALKAEGLAAQHVSAQDLGWAKLSPSYVAQKIREGHSELTLVATSTYFSSITSWVIGDTGFAGVKRDVREKDGTETHNIAAIMEFGTDNGNVPARPLWKPVFEEALQWHIHNNSPVEIFRERIKKYQ